MPAVEPLHNLIGFRVLNLTRKETIFFEAELFIHVCNQLKEIFRAEYHRYFQLIRFDTEKEEQMLENEFLRLIIKDILSTDEYSLNGIACYTQTHKDVILEVMAGRNPNPSAHFFRRLIDLHRLVKRDLYAKIIEKIKEQYAVVA